MLSWIARWPQHYQKALYKRGRKMKVRRNRWGDGSRGSESERDLKSKAAGFEERRRGLEPRNVGSHQKLEEVRKQVLRWSLWSEPEPVNTLISA